MSVLLFDTNLQRMGSPYGAHLLRKRVSPSGPTTSSPRPKNDHSGRFLYGLFESASLLRKYALPPSNLITIKIAKKIDPKVQSVEK